MLLRRAGLTASAGLSCLLGEINDVAYIQSVTPAVHNEQFN